MPMGGTERLVLLFDESTSFPQEPGFYLEDSKVVEDPFEDPPQAVSPMQASSRARTATAAGFAAVTGRRLSTLM